MSILIVISSVVVVRAQLINIHRKGQYGAMNWQFVDLCSISALQVISKEEKVRDLNLHVQSSFLF